MVARINRYPVYTDRKKSLSKVLFLLVCVCVCVCKKGKGVAKSVERSTPGEEVSGSIPAVTARSLLVGSVSV